MRIQDIVGRDDQFVDNDTGKPIPKAKQNKPHPIRRMMDQSVENESYDELEELPSIDKKPNVEFSDRVVKSKSRPDGMETQSEYVKPDSVDRKEDWKLEKGRTLENYQRIGLPSRFIPYSFKSLQIRKLKVMDLRNISEAMSTGNFSGLVDALGSTIDQDIRELTIPDFYFIMHWLRLNSYTNTPFIIKWKSRYGNENEYEVRNSNLEIIELNMSYERYNKYLESDICFPTVRIMEFLENTKLSESDNWFFKYAQYMTGNTIEEKENKFHNSPDLSIIEKIEEFKKESNHGVIQTIIVEDEKFQLGKALSYLRSVYLSLRNEINLATDLNPEIIRELSDQMRDLSSEIREMETCLQEKINYKPRKEEIALQAKALQFFPFL